MKFTTLACLLGVSQAITIWTTRGEIAYYEDDNEPEAMNIQLDDWHPGQHETLGAAAYERVIPARFSTDDDPRPCGKFVMNESTMRAAASEVLCTHKGLC